MDCCNKAAFNRQREGRVESALSTGGNKAFESYRLFARALLATSISVAAGTATANTIIDNGMSQNVPSGMFFDAGGYLIVGGNGFGQLDIADGGRVINTDAYIGFSNMSQGEVFVSGANARWTTNGFLTIGLDGQAIVVVD
ncbi:MAG TPA: hypothetical protein VN156_18095, partial [Pseudomonas sp.]|nr:hypothetical protein [Pseudomonas sp.]